MAFQLGSKPWILHSLTLDLESKIPSNSRTFFLAELALGCENDSQHSQHKINNIQVYKMRASRYIHLQIKPQQLPGNNPA